MAFSSGTFSVQEAVNFRLMFDQYTAGTLDMRKMVAGSPPEGDGWTCVSAVANDGALVWKAKRSSPNNRIVEWRNGYRAA